MTEPSDEHSLEQDAAFVERLAMERAWEIRFAAVLTQKAPLTKKLVFLILGIHALLELVALPMNLGSWSPAGPEFFFVLMMAGAKVNSLIDAGEYWRFLAAVWLHASLLHLALNAMALHYLGRLIENLLGARAFLIVFLASGLMGSLCSYGFSEEPSVGASGAIFGLLGAAASYGLVNRNRIPKRLKRFLVFSPLLWIVLNLVVSIMIPRIDMAAHSGGLILGFALGPMLGDRILMRPTMLPHRFTKTVWAVLILSNLITFGFMAPRLLGQAPDIKTGLRQEVVGDTRFSVPERWRRGVLVHGSCVSPLPGEAPILGSAALEICYEDPYQAILFIYPIDMLEKGGGGLGQEETPAGFLRVTDSDDVPVFRRKQLEDEAFNLQIASAGSEHTFVLRSWKNLSAAYLPLLRALVRANSARGR